jgi:3-ketosteroid 9alpha-monooxygenase subunit B
MNDAPSPTRSRIKELEVMVADTVIETPDTTTLVLFTGNDHLDYKAGHFLTIDPDQFEPLERAFTRSCATPSSTPTRPGTT